MTSRRIAAALAAGLALAGCGAATHAAVVTIHQAPPFKVPKLPTTTVAHSAPATTAAPSTTTVLLFTAPARLAAPTTGQPAGQTGAAVTTAEPVTSTDVVNPVDTTVDNSTTTDATTTTVAPTTTTARVTTTTQAPTTTSTTVPAAAQATTTITVATANLDPSAMGGSVIGFYVTLQADPASARYLAGDVEVSALNCPGAALPVDDTVFATPTVGGSVSLPMMELSWPNVPGCGVEQVTYSGGTYTDAAGTVWTLLPATVQVDA